MSEFIVSDFAAFLKGNHDIQYFRHGFTHSLIRRDGRPFPCGLVSLVSTNLNALIAQLALIDMFNQAMTAKPPAPALSTEVFARSVRWGSVALMLRTSGPGRQSYGGFQWPEAGGGIVEAQDWDPNPDNDHGLHGLLWGMGSSSVLMMHQPDRVWQVCSVLVDQVVMRDSTRGLVKVPQAQVEYSGDRAGAVAFLLRHAPLDKEVFGAARAGAGLVQVGDSGAAVAAGNGHAIAGDMAVAAAGDEGQATVGYCGVGLVGHNGTVNGLDGSICAGGRRARVSSAHDGVSVTRHKGFSVSGDRGLSFSGEGGESYTGDYGQAIAGAFGRARSGDGGFSIAGENGEASTGDFGHAIAGPGGRVRGGQCAVLEIAYRDALNRVRMVTGYTDGDYRVSNMPVIDLDPQKWYRLEETTTGDRAGDWGFVECFE